MGEIVRIPFQGDDLLAVEHEGRPWIVLKPAMEVLGLAYSAQLTKLRGKSWACVSTIGMQVHGDDQIRQVVVVDVRTFLMLLATVSEGRVAEHVRPKLAAYQAEVADVIESYFTKGGAINPNATPEQLETLSERAIGQAAVLKAFDGFLDHDWLQSKAKQVIARALGEEPDIAFEDRPITVGEYLDDVGVVGARQKPLAGRFGKELKRLYRQKYSQDPGQVPRDINGRNTMVYAYIQRDRPLFDEAWRRVS